MGIPQPSNEVRRFLAAAGAQGGKAVTPKKLAHLRKISKADKPLISRKAVRQPPAAEIPPATEEIRNFLGAIGAKGGASVTPAKRAHLQAISSKGGKSLTPKKLAQLQAMREKRWAKAAPKRANET